MKHQWFEISNKAPDAAEILIYDEIGKDWMTQNGIGAKDFAESLAKIPKSAKITVGINSPGGNVWDGLAIYHQLKARGENVTTRIDGVAASIASVIALAGHEVQMPENALMMVHRAWGMGVGNAEEMIKLAEDLQKHDQVIAGIYANKNGKSVEDNLGVMAQETWFTGAEAKHFGLVDTVTDKVAINNKFDLSKYNFKNISEAASGLQVSQESIETATAHDATSSISAACAAEKQTAAVESGGINNQKKDQPMENIQAAAVTSTANSDNSAVLARIDALEAKLIKPGAEPISATSNIEVADSDAVRQFKNLRHGSEKRDFIVSNYARLTAELPKHGIYNANTIDSGLANSLLASDAVQTMRTYVAPLGAFTKAVSVSPISPRQVINVPLVSSSGSIQTNPTNFETGDTTAGDIAVTVNQYSKSWAVSHAEGNLGLKLAQLAPTNAAVLSEGLVALVTAKMTNANYGADNVIGAAANFDSADLPAVLALGKNFSRVTLLLDGGHLAYLLPTTRESFVFGEARSEEHTSETPVTSLSRMPSSA